MNISEPHVGQTPLVELRSVSPKPEVRIFAKLEGFNPSGSIKDRVAYGIVSDAEDKGLLKPGDTIVEASTGNTAIAIAMLAKRRGYRSCLIIPEGVVPSILDILNLLDVQIIRTKPKAGVLGAIEKSFELAEKDGWFAVRQFHNQLNLSTHHDTTGEEIAHQMPQVDVLVTGVGTGGTLMGAGKRLRALNPDLKLVAVEPKLGERLQGLRSMEEGYELPLVSLDILNARYLVSNDVAIREAKRLAHDEGLLVGVSSGAVMHGALRYAEKLDRGNIVVIFADGGWKYLPANPWQNAEASDPKLNDMHWW